jgi:hypothetical protein
LKQKKYNDDDGRTVASMNVDGMRWYVPKAEKTASEEQSGTREMLHGAERRA